MKYHDEQKILRLLGILAPALFVGAMSWGFLFYSWQQGREAQTSYEAENNYTGIGGIYLQDEDYTKKPVELNITEDNISDQAKSDLQEISSEDASATAAVVAVDVGLGTDLALDQETVEKTNWTAGAFEPPVFWWTGRQVLRGYGLSYAATYEDYRFHSGLDFAAGLSEEVLASAPGVVQEVTMTREKNYTVVLLHKDDWESHYSHLGTVQVKKGEVVGLGQVLGLVGESGTEEQGEGPHVHWELWQGDERKNPTKYTTIEK